MDLSKDWIGAIRILASTIGLTEQDLRDMQITRERGGETSPIQQMCSYAIRNERPHNAVTHNDHKKQAQT